MILSAQDKLVKDAVSEVCFAHVLADRRFRDLRSVRTQIRRRHAGSGALTCV
jgi:hypothetical protein